MAKGGKSSGYSLASMKVERISPRLSELTGTEKQIAWAKDIRSKTIDTINDAIEHTNEMTDKNTKKYKKYLDSGQYSKSTYDEKIKKRKEVTAQKKKEVAGIAKYISSITSASDWINHMNSKSKSYADVLLEAKIAGFVEFNYRS